MKPPIRSRWKPALLAREALANVRSSRHRLQPILIAAVLLGVAGPIVGAIDAVSYRADMRALEQAGANVIVVSAKEGEQGIDRRSCDRLRDLTGVARSGSVLKSTRYSVVGVGANVAVVPVTGNLAPELATSPVAIGHELATAATQTLVLAGVAVEGRREMQQPDGVPLNRALSIGASPDIHTVERCIVVLESGVSAAPSTSILLAALDARTRSLVATPVLEQTVDRTDAFLQRPTRWFPVAAGLLLGALQAVIMMTRQSEFAAYRLSGSPTPALRSILILETLIITGAMATSTTAAALVLHEVLLDVPAVAFGGLGAASIALLLGVVAATTTSRQSLLSLTKER